MKPAGSKIDKEGDELQARLDAIAERAQTLLNRWEADQGQRMRQLQIK